MNNSFIKTLKKISINIYFRENWFPPRRGVAGFGQPPPGGPAAARAGGGGWGRGNTLGQQ